MRNRTVSLHDAAIICCWLSKDPIGIAGGLNQYVAFANNPVMFVDPWGLCVEPLPDNAGFWTGFTKGFTDSLRRQADSFVSFYKDVFTGNWDNLYTWHADSALGQADAAGGATRVITYSAVGVSSVAAITAGGLIAVEGYQKLPPTLRYAVIDILLNGFDMAGGADRVYPDPNPPNPVEGPFTPGGE